MKIKKYKNKYITKYGKFLLKDRYLLYKESYQEIFIRISKCYSENNYHAKRLYKYISNLWFMPATPILSNGGTKRGLPISCFVNEVEDNLQNIINKWGENAYLSSKGGGIGTYWGNVRSIGEKIANSGKTSGIIPFLAVQDKLTLAISQGSLRRGSTAVYINIEHPEIEEFLNIRKPTGGDPNRKTLNIHHGIIINDEFMKKIRNNNKYYLIDPKEKKIIKKNNARNIWVKILLSRIETGEPYIIFINNVNNKIPDIYKKNKIKIKTSNLCSEITLATGQDYNKKSRTAICCLSSLNLEKYNIWIKEKKIIIDIIKFLDNIIEFFINKASKRISNAIYSAKQERSIGLGVMGFHAFLQSQMIPIESSIAKKSNIKIFYYINKIATKISYYIAKKKGGCRDSININKNIRFANITAIAPTASISIIANETSPGIEPYICNIYTNKNITGSFNIKNKYLIMLLKIKKKNTNKIWIYIINKEGSIKYIKYFNQYQQSVFKTAFEINQKWIIEHASNRTKYINQSQSLNIFIKANIKKYELHQIHYQAWLKGVKSMYYCRSKSIQRVENISRN